MSIKVKICGLKTINQVNASIKGNAEMIGLMFYKKSPRYIDIKTAKKLSDYAGKKIKKVGIISNMKINEIKKIVQSVNLDFLQFHGDETPDFLNKIKKENKIKIIKAIKIFNKNDLKKINIFKNSTDFILLDSKIIKKSNNYNAIEKSKKINQNLLKNISDKNKKKLILSGALNKKNLEETIIFTKIKFIDVSSSLEDCAGVKNIKKITSFLKLASKLKI